MLKFVLGYAAGAATVIVLLILQLSQPPIKHSIDWYAAQHKESTNIQIGYNPEAKHVWQRVSLGSSDGLDLRIIATCRERKYAVELEKKLLEVLESPEFIEEALREE